MSTARKLAAFLLISASVALGACGGETGSEPGGPAPVEESPAGGGGGLYD